MDSEQPIICEAFVIHNMEK